MDYYSIYKPDFTPKQMFSMGIYYGSYFRPIYSSIISKNLKNQHKEFKFLKNIANDKIFSGNMDKEKNFYKVKSGQSLEVWEKNYLKKYNI